MKYDLSKYLYHFLSFKMKSFAPVSSAISGDLNRYKDMLSYLDNNCVSPHKVYLKEENDRKIKVCYTDNNELYVEVLQNDIYLKVYIGEDRNKIEIIESKIDSETNQTILVEESEYLYEPDIRKYYVYHGQRSLITNEELMSISTYDKDGNEEKRNMYYNKREQNKVKRKTM